MELGFLRRIEFFPKKPAQWADLTELCLATKSRNLGDALVLTSLAGSLARAYPRMRLSTYVRGFNPLVFAGNPVIPRVSRLPRAVYGDDCNEGGGNLIHLKERFFGLPLSPAPAPEIHLTADEREWATHEIAYRTEPSRSRLPKVFIHPWGVTRQQPLDNAGWDALVRRHRDRFSFWQLGMEWHSAVEGCDHYVFLKRRPAEARKLFALMTHARAFIGVDSGPMHVARAFGVRSLVLTSHIPEPSATMAQWLDLRDRAPLPLEPSFAFLYRENAHVAATEGPDAVLAAAARFLEA